MPSAGLGARFRRRPRTTGVALAGAGYIAVVHALAADSAGLKVRAVASAGGRSARHLAGELDARRCRPEELPAGAEVMIIATPPETHTELALLGVRAGARVLVEKPLATTLADADRIVAAVVGGGSTHSESTAGPRARDRRCCVRRTCSTPRHGGS